MASGARTAATITVRFRTAPNVGASAVPEQIVINKIDQADHHVLLQLRSQFPEAIFVSARTGEGIETLRAITEAQLPMPEVEVRALVPYERGDLLDKVHRQGQFITTEHTDQGTRIVALMNPELAAEFGEFPTG